MPTHIFHRLGQAKRSQNKLLLLPINRASADDISLRYHVSLEALRVGRGYAGAAQALAEATVVTFFLVNAGYGEMPRETFSMSEDILAGCFETGRITDEWHFDDRSYQHFSALLSLHDSQLRKAPLSTLLRANHQLNAFLKGKVL